MFEVIGHKILLVVQKKEQNEHTTLLCYACFADNVFLPVACWLYTVCTVEKPHIIRYNCWEMGDVFC